MGDRRSGAEGSVPESRTHKVNPLFLKLSSLTPTPHGPAHGNWEPRSMETETLARGPGVGGAGLQTDGGQAVLLEGLPGGLKATYKQPGLLTASLEAGESNLGQPPQNRGVERGMGAEGNSEMEGNGPKVGGQVSPQERSLLAEGRRVVQALMAPGFADYSSLHVGVAGSQTLYPLPPCPSPRGRATA